MKAKAADICKIKLVKGTDSMTVECGGGALLMDVLKNTGVYIEAPCGGKGLCGKCKVRVEGNAVTPPEKGELKFISDKEKEKGYRLACCVKVLGDIQVYLDDSEKGMQIVADGAGYKVELLPVVRREFMELQKPSIHDQRDDLERITGKLKPAGQKVPIDLIRNLHDIIRKEGFKVTITYDDIEIFRIESGDTSEAHYGVAVDIGTTTVVSYLLDLRTGRQVDVISQINLQKAFGSDVISRVAHTIEDSNGLTQLQSRIVKQINAMAGQLASRNEIDMKDISAMVFAGNTIMMHLLVGFHPKNIAAAPFTPVAAGRLSCSAKELGMDISDTCRIFLLPSISGYVGADIVAGILSSRMAESEELSLLIDIGTNGEIALGSKEHIVCCSTAAGPAFEGAQIRNGVGGIQGAINTVRVENGQVKYTTIYDSRPIGICGSGIVDAVAVLIENGIIDETGRFVDRDELPDGAAGLAGGIVEVDGMRAFVIAPAAETEAGEDIVITQKDVREIQLAKAAIAAGISTLVKSLGKKTEDIDVIYLAGGFGSYMDTKSAVTVGILPRQLLGKIRVIGNAAGAGAIMSLLNSERYLFCDRIKGMAEYIELSALPGFQDELVDCMYFE